MKYIKKKLKKKRRETLYKIIYIFFFFFIIVFDFLLMLNEYKGKDNIRRQQKAAKCDINLLSN